VRRYLAIAIIAAMGVAMALATATTIARHGNVAFDHRLMARAH